MHHQTRYSSRSTSTRSIATPSGIAADAVLGRASIRQVLRARGIQPVREMIKKIFVIATPKGQESPLTVEGDLAVMLGLERDAPHALGPVVPPPRIERGTSRSTI